MLGESWDAYGYGNPVLTVSLTGAQLDAVLEQQWQTQTDGTVKFAPSPCPAMSPTPSTLAARSATASIPADVKIDGSALDPAKTYRWPLWPTR
jgi:5'-nucleotidase